MKIQYILSIFVFLSFIGTTGAQRTEFQRKKFDRSVFDKPAPGEPARPTPAPAPAPQQQQQRSSMSYLQSSSAPAAEEEFKPPPQSYNPEGGSGTSPEARAEARQTAQSNRERLKALVDAPLLDQVPSKWYNNAKDYEELVELQNNTGACMIIYFKNPTVSNEKGLCNWFEKEIMQDIKWRKAMRYFIKMEIQLPGNSATRELAAKFGVKSTPAVFAIKPNSMPTRVTVFEWKQGQRPKPLETDVVLDYLRTRSTEAYQSLF